MMKTELPDEEALVLSFSNPYVPELREISKVGILRSSFRKSLPAPFNKESIDLR